MHRQSMPTTSQRVVSSREYVKEPDVAGWLVRRRVVILGNVPHLGFDDSLLPTTERFDMRMFTIGLTEKHGKRLLGLFLFTKACSRKSVRAVLVDDYIYISVRDTRVVNAVFHAYISGRGMGYYLGPMPAKGVGTVIFPRSKP